MFGSGFFSSKNVKKWRLASILVFMVVIPLVFLHGCGETMSLQLKEKINAAITTDAELTDPVFDFEGKFDKFNVEKLHELCDKAIENRTLQIKELKEVDSDVGNELKRNLIRFFELENEAFTIKKKYGEVLTVFLELHEKYEKGREEANRIGGDHWAPYLANLRDKLTKSGTEYKQVVKDYRNIADRLATMGELITEDLKQYRIKKRLSYAKFAGLDDAAFVYWRKKIDQTIRSF